MIFINKLYKTLFVFAAVVIVASCSIPKAFEAYEVYNYFQAKKYFEKAVKRNPVIAKYGLSLIQQRTDNPFFNLDSAYYNITFAVVNYDSLSIKKKDKYAELGVTRISVINQQALIARNMFTRAVKANTEKDFQSFIEKNPTSSLVQDAIFFRDSLFYLQVKEINTAEAYKSFLGKYPNSSFKAQAFERYERQLYAEKTEKNDLKSYINFISDYPENPFVFDAENQIYKIETELESVSSYELFIKRHPKNRNIRDAWRKLYDAYLTENLTDSAIANFIVKYPNNPFKDEVENDLALSKTILFPVQSAGKWGFMSEKGTYYITGDYDFVDHFSEGLALAVKDEKVGFITKLGLVKIDFKFDDALPFSEGTAVVEVLGKYGLINRQGAFIIPPEFDYLGSLKNGLIPFELNGKFGYFDSKGNIKIKSIFDNAYNFNNHIAIVSVNKNWGVISSTGTYLFDPIYSSITQLSDSIFALYTDDKKGGALSLKKDTILPFIYDDISKLSNRFYLVTKQDSFNYINQSGQVLLPKNWQPVYPEYKILAKFEKNPILVSRQDGYNYMNLDGSLVFKTSKNQLGEFSELIAFEQNELWGYLSPYPAREVIEPRFNKATSFKYDYGIVSLAPFYGTISKEGKFVIPAFFEELTFVNDKLLIAKGKGNHGMLNVLGDTILPFTKRKIEPFSRNIVKVYEATSVSYYNYISKSWIRKED
ncbi:MAG: WG repeat-containing protein [Crocinitomicaceae bacterium]